MLYNVLNRRKGDKSANNTLLAWNKGNNCILPQKVTIRETDIPEIFLPAFLISNQNLTNLGKQELKELTEWFYGQNTAVSVCLCELPRVVQMQIGFSKMTPR